MKNIAVNGFGRIGRTFLRAALKDDEFNKMINVTAINDLGDLNSIAHLFKYDSVYGKFDGTVIADKENNCLIITIIKSLYFLKKIHNYYLGTVSKLMLFWNRPVSLKIEREQASISRLEQKRW